MTDHFNLSGENPKRASHPLCQRPSLPWRVGTALAFFLALTGIGGHLQEAFALSITLDTTALAGTDARLEFDLLDGDLSENNNATISGLTTDGILGTATCDVGVSCTGGPPFTISDTGGLGQFLQDLTLGNSVSFNLDFTNNFAGDPGTPDRLVLFLLDPGTNFSLIDTDLDRPDDQIPFEDALLFVELGGPQAGVVQIANVTNPAVKISVVPEPSTIILMMVCLPFLFWRTLRPLRHF